MTSRGRTLWVVCALGVSSGALSVARADDTRDPVLERYVRALQAKKLAAPSASGLEELRPRLEAAQTAALSGNDAEALSLLLEIVEGPRFREYAGFDEFHVAELMLASALTEQFALTSAERVVERILARGPDGSAFGPAYRRAVDIALARGNLDASAARLATFHRDRLPEDAANELSYLEGRAAYDRQDLTSAAKKLGAVTKKSRFFASAQYLLGAMAAKSRDYREAERRFCAITEAGKDDAYSFFVDERFFPIRDLAQLALGRVAHETGRANDAFYYYFQVPNDSERLPEAMFEAAWASYEGGDYESALDSLDQLEARFSRSPFAAEAAVLRGYVHLSRCEFAEAERHLTQFERDFTPVLRQIGATRDSASRSGSVYADLMAREASAVALRTESREGSPTPDNLLLSLVKADPELFRLDAEIRALDAELARTGNVPRELYALSARLSEGHAPAARLEPYAAADEVAETRDTIAELERAVHALSRDIGQLSRAGAERSELSALRQTRRQLDRELAQARHMLAEAVTRVPGEIAQPSAEEIVALLREDEAYVESVRAEALEVRRALLSLSDLALDRTLRELNERLASELRRARIGRIDAVMGAKRKLELQIESLAAGRFPPELADALRMQSLLRDDEEYWPFEGEDWPDEFLELYPEEDEP